MASRLAGALVLFASCSFAISASATFTAASSVPGSSVAYRSLPHTWKDAVPADCARSVTNLVTGSGTFSGSAQADLILGSAGNDQITGLQGNDCILGGAGNDSLDGGSGNDTLIGGPDVDVCTGGSGPDYFPRSDCETVN